MLARKADGHVDGFIVEGPTAGGHNAPPRGKAELNDRGEPVYGKRDDVDLSAFRKLGRPFWLAGSYGSPDQVAAARSAGAVGVQVGTAFAFCEESGMDRELKRRVIELARQEELDVITDPAASPTGFPFKVLALEGTASEPSIVQQRQRVCDLGFLRQGYRRSDGSIGWRCPGESVKSYVHKGGQESDTVGRKCVCNGLMATIGLAQQRRDRGREPALVTCGNAVQGVTRFLPSEDAIAYRADDVIDYLMSEKPAEKLQGV
jgi:nitronate monooxygenase